MKDEEAVKFFLEWSEDSKDNACHEKAMDTLSEYGICQHNYLRTEDYIGVVEVIAGKIKDALGEGRYKRSKIMEYDITITIRDEGINVYMGW